MEHRGLGARRAALARHPRARPPGRPSALEAGRRRELGHPGVRALLQADRPARRALRGPRRGPQSRADDGADVRPRVHVRARPLAGLLLRNAVVAVTRLRILLFCGALALLAPQAAFARGNFDPTTEFEQHEWIPIHLGPLNLSITKAVVYLMIGTACTIGLGIFTMRSRLALLPGRRQTVGEALYDVAQTQIARQGLPTKALGRWFPYVATLLLFIFVVNLLGFIPLPLTGETYHSIPTWGIYAATSSLSVTLALALLTFLFTHFEGIRWNGPSRYFKSWIPEAPKGLLLLIVPLEVLGQFMRLISLSVRLFANMLAGHILILTFLGLIFIFESFALVFVIVPATIFYIFEVVIVVGIQAFIFAALSAIYIGSAIEPEH
ncbi:MAG: F0F1 ATP synthase subunit A [Actinobacteria bacterium]|nr:MAG: F0F1 ATP synthase subunit A [Actinomycetota bacterium]